VVSTVQPKNVTHPTDAKLLLTATLKLGELAKAQGVKLRQSYARLAKRAALMAGPMPTPSSSSAAPGRSGSCVIAFGGHRLAEARGRCDGAIIFLKRPILAA
jgi:hypothetical protein